VEREAVCAREVRSEIRRALGVGAAAENHIHMPDSPGETLANMEQFLGSEALAEQYRKDRARPWILGGLLFTGLYWERDRPTVTGLVGNQERRRPVELGQGIGWELMGPRRCIGVYDRLAARRRPCPVGGLIDEGGQCDVCQRADTGRLVARGLAPAGLEQEPFVLYLAWFGDGLSKVGITAEERGEERLYEQAALSWCVLARGPFGSIRRAEIVLSGLGVAPERVTTRTKQAAWWWVPAAEQREAELAVLHGTASDAIRRIGDIELQEFRAVDLTSRFGLDRGMPARYELVTAVRSGARVSGTVSQVIGRWLVLGPPAVVIDARLLEGWTLRRSSGPGGGLDVEAWSREAEARAVQRNLF
jgi:hypothetical protein